MIIMNSPGVLRKQPLFARLEKKVMRAIKPGVNTVVFLQPPPDKYFDVTALLVSVLTTKGFKGVYVSIQRPYNNVVTMFKRKGIKTNRLFFVDVASSLTGEKGRRCANCTTVKSPVGVDAVIKSIKKSLSRVTSRRRFIFVDSLSTFAVYAPLSDVLRFSRSLVRVAETQKSNSNIIVLTAAEREKDARILKSLTRDVDVIVRTRN